MSRGGSRPGAGRKKGQKDVKPRKGSPGEDEAKKIKQMLSMAIKAKARFYQEFLIRVANKDGQQKPLSIAEKRLMGKLGDELEAEKGEKKTEAGSTDLEAGEFLRKVWNDPQVDMALRIRAAEVAHKEAGGPKGKKDEKKGKAEEAGKGRFAASRPPLSVVK